MLLKTHEKVNTGDRVRTYDLGVMSPARFLCATPVKHVALLWSSRPSPGDTFRSYDLEVMSLARYLCATPGIPPGGLIRRPQDYESCALPLS